jgi:hypothetical protein
VLILGILKFNRQLGSIGVNDHHHNNFQEKENVKKMSRKRKELRKGIPFKTVFATNDMMAFGAEQSTRTIIFMLTGLVV